MSGGQTYTMSGNSSCTRSVLTLRVPRWVIKITTCLLGYAVFPSRLYRSFSEEKQVLRAVAAPPPTAARLDQYVYGIARANNVNWLPDLSPEQKYVHGM